MKLWTMITLAGLIAALAILLGRTECVGEYHHGAQPSGDIVCRWLIDGVVP